MNILQMNAVLGQAPLTIHVKVISNFIFLPFADKLKGKSEGKKVESALILEGSKRRQNVCFFMYMY